MFGIRLKRCHNDNCFQRLQNLSKLSSVDFKDIPGACKSIILWIDKQSLELSFVVLFCCPLFEVGRRFNNHKVNIFKHPHLPKYSNILCWDKFDYRMAFNSYLNTIWMYVFRHIMILNDFFTKSESSCPAYSKRKRLTLDKIWSGQAEKSRRWKFRTVEHGPPVRRNTCKLLLCLSLRRSGSGSHDW